MDKYNISTAHKESMPLYVIESQPEGDDDPVETIDSAMFNFVMPNFNECKYLFRMK